MLQFDVPNCRATAESGQKNCLHSRVILIFPAPCQMNALNPCMELEYGAFGEVNAMSVE